MNTTKTTAREFLALIAEDTRNTQETLNQLTEQIENLKAKIVTPATEAYAWDTNTPVEQLQELLEAHAFNSWVVHNLPNWADRLDSKCETTSEMALTLLDWMEASFDCRSHGGRHKVRNFRSTMFHHAMQRATK